MERRVSINSNTRISRNNSLQGAKNEALQILCATLLTSEPVTVYNLPRIKDVLLLIRLLEELGVEIEQLGESAYRFRAGEVNLDYFSTDAGGGQDRKEKT